MKIFSLLIGLTLAFTAYASKQEFNIRIHSEPPTLDWNLATDNVSITLLQNLMEGLASYNDKLEPVPALAENWKVSKDGKTYTYTLKKGIKWSDGTPLTAQHFWDSWERLLNPKTASEYAYFLFDVKGAQEYNEGKLTDSSKLGIKVVGDDKFVVTLNKRASFFPTIPTFTATFPIRKDLIAKHGDKWTMPGNMQVLGPFQLTEWKHDSKVVLQANPNYYNGKVALEKVNAYIVNEDTTAINMFESGSLHYVSRLPALEIDRLKKSPAYKNAPFLRGYYYGFNMNKPPFNDVRVRKAFAHAIDRKQIVTLLKGGQIPTTSWVPKGMPGYEPTVGLDFDPKKAKALLAEAGYPEGKGFPDVTFMFDTRDDNKVIAERLQAMWRENLNVNLKAQNEDWKVYLNRLKSDVPAMFRLGWGADYPDPDNFLNLFTSFSGNNHTQWKNKEYDNIIAKAAGEPNMAKRLRLYKQAQVLLTEKDVAIIPLFIDSLNVLVSPTVKGLSLNAMDQLQLRDVKMQ
ncbi:MAG: peptide ABC transporter substrate-binding protein [Oligoflexia bacterium]|nr:peptide ABC transporter substrate-binding protein [Oligoflexia bacterium]